MKQLILIMALVSLGGCATTALDSGKALALAWQGLDTAAVASDEMVMLGKLKGAQAGVVAADLRKARAALKVVTAANGAANTADPSAQIAIAESATAEILSIVAQVKGQ